MATEIRDASGALIGEQLEHTAQQVDDAVEDVAGLKKAGSGLTDEAKQALLTCFRNVAWINDQGQSYYDALEDALYPPIRATSITLNTDTVKLKALGATQQLTATVLPADSTDRVVWASSNTSVATVVDGLVTSIAYGSATITATAGDVSASASVLVAQAEVTGITAVFEQEGAVIYDNASLDDLKPMLTVTASYDDGTSQTVTDYTLSGTLAEGTSTITVSYGGKSATFNVTVSADGSRLLNWNLQQSLVDSVTGATATLINGAQQNANGLVLTANTDCARFPGAIGANKTIEIDIDSLSKPESSGSHGRLATFMPSGGVKRNTGLILRNWSNWAWFVGSWSSNGLAGLDILNGKTLVIKVGSDLIPTAYVDGQVVAAASTAISFAEGYENALFIGSDAAVDRSSIGAVITAIRVYEGVK